MAATWMVQAGIFANAASRIYFYMLNTSATNVIKIRRVWIVNTFIGTAYSGGLNQFNLSKETGTPSGGASLTARAFDSTSTALSSLTILGYSTAITGTTQGAIFRQFLVGGDELTGRYNSAPVLDDLWGNGPFTCVWDAGVGEPTIQPITLRQNQGFSVRTTSSVTSGGGFDIVVEFTRE